MKIVGSLTTMPDHYDKLLRTLKSLHEQTVPLDNIYLALPETSRRLGTLYPPLTEDISRLCTVVPCIDYGPITKLMGALLSESDPETIIVTFDDDIIYPKTLVEKLLIHHKEYPKSAIGSSGMLLTYTCPWCAITPNENSGIRASAKFPIPAEGRPVDSIYGYPGALYLRSFFPSKDRLESDLLKYPLMDDSLLCNDDITISGYLSLRGIERRIFNDIPEIQHYEEHGVRVRQESELSYDLNTCMTRMNTAIEQCKKLNMFSTLEPVSATETLGGIVLIVIIAIIIMIFGITFLFYY
jgi:hypothetical protein